jgi:hypothetical protein
MCKTAVLKYNPCFGYFWYCSTKIIKAIIKFYVTFPEQGGMSKTLKEKAQRSAGYFVDYTRMA